MLFSIFLIQLAGLASPGPDFFYISKTSAKYGLKTAVFASLGIALGILFWVFVAMFALGIIANYFYYLPKIITILGGSFLAYLGYKMMRSNGVIENENNIEQVASKPLIEIKKALFINLSNAKAMVFFSTVLSGFVPSFQSSFDYIFVILIIFFSTFFYFVLVGLFFSREFFRKKYIKNARLIDILAGCIFVFFGCKLVLSQILV